MATPKTLVSVEPIHAMIQKAQSLLDEATALGQQYVAHSQDILGSGWGGDAAQRCAQRGRSPRADHNRHRRRRNAHVAGECRDAWAGGARRLG
jgi:hypothetical protein